MLHAEGKAVVDGESAAGSEHCNSRMRNPICMYMLRPTKEDFPLEATPNMGNLYC